MAMKQASSWHQMPPSWKERSCKPRQLNSWMPWLAMSMQVDEDGELVVVEREMG